MGQEPQTLCPSARPEMEGSVLFGVVAGSRDAGTAFGHAAGLVGYLKEPLAPTADVLARAEPVGPTAVFRFAAPCAESACAHFDGADCRLATKVVDLLPPVVAVLPPCPVRQGCRWWRQEGRAACLRCPAISTATADPSNSLRRAADPAVAGPRPGAQNR